MAKENEAVNLWISDSGMSDKILNWQKILDSKTFK